MKQPHNAAKLSLILINYLTYVDNLTKQQIIPTTIYLPLIAVVLNLRKPSIFNKLEIFKASNVPRHTITITAVVFFSPGAACRAGGSRSGVGE